MVWTDHSSSRNGDLRRFIILTWNLCHFKVENFNYTHDL
jgi:hypothetical protein